MIDYTREYKNKCLTCSNYDISSQKDATTRGYRCVRHHRPMAMDESCSSYSRNYARGNQMIESAIKWMGKHGYDPRRDNASLCYITTIVCDILGKDDDHYYLTSLRKLRNNYLMTFELGQKVLFDYDTYGALVSNYIAKDENAFDYIKEVIEPNYLIPICNYIDNEDYKLATNLYLKMTFHLLDRYHLVYSPINEKPNEKQLENLGHARILRKSR